MRLSHPFFQQPIHFTEGKIQTLILEDPCCFRTLLEELLAQSEGERGRFILSKNYNPLDMATSMELILDYYHLNTGQKKIQTRLSAYLKALAQQELTISSLNVCQTLNSYFTEIVTSADYPLLYTPVEDIVSVIKLANITIELSQDNLGEKLLDYMVICQKICRVECFVLVNLKSYLSEEELNAFYRSALGKKVHILLLENTARPIMKEYENTLLVDSDLCELSVADLEK